MLLHRLSHKYEGNKWGLPAGKLNPGEADVDAAIREVFEETSIHIRREKLEDLGVHVLTFSDIEETLSLFSIELTMEPKVKIHKNEHQTFQWVTPEECYAHGNLVHGLEDLLERIGYVPGR